MKRVLLLVCISLCAIQVFAQSKKVRGKVTDEAGIPLVGATISAVGGKANTISNASGAFEITVPGTVTQLAISYVGYTAQTVDVSTEPIAVKLKGGTSLENVVVTGYTSVKKSQYAGAASKVTAEKINFVPMGSFDQILQGRAAGLLVTAGTGQPGASARVQIRGQSSITGGNDPLYILDGTPIESGVFRTLNPNDFESVDILRDAVATAQYGNRGAGGVIVITTKKGRAGKPVLSYNLQYGWTKPGKQQFSMMNSAELLQYQEMLGKLVGADLPGWKYSALNPANASLTPGEKQQNAATLDSFRNINTDWSKIFQRTGRFTSHDLSLSGGSANTRFFISGAYYTEQGIALRSDLKRYTLRANIENKTDKLTVNLNSSLGYTKRNNIESEGALNLGNPFAAAYLALPYDVLRRPDGSLAVGSGKTGANAYDRIESGINNRGEIKGVLNLSLNYNIAKHFSVGGSAGLDYTQTVSERTILPNTYFANNQNFPLGPIEGPGQGIGYGLYSNGFNRTFEYIARANVTYRNIFKDRHDVEATFISEYTRDNIQTFGYTGYGLSSKLVNTPASITPGDTINQWIPTVSGGKADRALYAAIFLGRYTLDGKYTFNLSLRRDGSSQLPRKGRFQNFYALGGTWNILKENFTRNWNAFSDLRLRLSYGTSASADNFSSGYYGAIETYVSSNYNGDETLLFNNIGNNNLTWEVVKQVNLGLDFALLRNRVRGTIDIYNKKTTNSLITQTLGLTGYGQSLNAATVGNKGIELTLNGDIIKTNSLTWSIGGNISYNNNKVLDLGGIQEFEQGTELVKVGLPLGSHYIVKWGGVDAASGAPLYWTKEREILDINGKKIIMPSHLTNQYSSEDQVSEFGTYNAPWIGGFNTSVAYKGFSLEAFFTFQKGFSRFNNQDYFQLNHAFAIAGYNMKQEMLTMWQKPGDITNIQSPLYPREFSSKDVQDASYLRFRNLTASYSLPASLLKNQNYVGSVRIYAQMQNVYTWTKWTGFDPEDSNNIATYEYPSPRTITLGLNVTFK